MNDFWLPGGEKNLEVAKLKLPNYVWLASCDACSTVADGRRQKKGSPSKAEVEVVNWTQYVQNPCISIRVTLGIRLNARKSKWMSSIKTTNKSEKKVDIVGFRHETRTADENGKRIWPIE